jgi:hypothetical protein
MKKNPKKHFLNFLESIKSEDPALIEAFNQSFNALYEASADDLLKIYGSVNGKNVFIEINIEDVDAHYIPLTRGSRDSYGAPEEPDDGDYWEVEGYKANAKLSPLDEDGEPTGEPSFMIEQKDFPNVMTEKKGYNSQTRDLQFMNLEQYVSEMVQDNAEKWAPDNSPDNYPED